MCRRPMSTITGEAAGNKEPMMTQPSSTPQRDRIRVRHVFRRPNRGVDLLRCRSMLSINGCLFRLGELAFLMPDGRVAHPQLRVREFPRLVVSREPRQPHESFDKPLLP